MEVEDKVLARQRRRHMVLSALEKRRQQVA